jgi:uncharacterized membrane protein
MAIRNGKVLLASAVVGLLAVGAMSAVAHAAEEGAKVSCYGANACKGKGDCGGKGHSCAGKNECKGQGYIETDSKEACLKMEGGRLTPEKN